MEVEQDEILHGFLFLLAFTSIAVNLHALWHTSKIRTHLRSGQKCSIPPPSKQPAPPPPIREQNCTKARNGSAPLVSLEEYLVTLLGESQAQSLLDAISDGKSILISGPQGATGKTALCHILRKRGVSAAEERELFQVVVQEPLKDQIPHMEDYVF